MCHGQARSADFGIPDAFAFVDLVDDADLGPESEDQYY